MKLIETHYRPLVPGWSPSEVAAVYPDGGVVRVNPSPVAGTWAFVACDKTDTPVCEVAGLVRPDAVWPGFADGAPPVSNNVTELIAIVAALQWLGDGWSGLVRSDSLNAITRARNPRTAKMNGAPDWLVAELTRRVERAGVLGFELLCGHPTAKEIAAGVGKRGYPVSVHNKRADALCQRMAEAAALTTPG